MEEQKKNSKEVKMEVAKGEKENPKKYTYDELNDIAGKLFNENRYLKNQLQQASDTIRTFSRLDYLFKVLENAEVFDDKQFVQKCTEEIKEVMTIPEETEEKENN